ncbi:MAG: hypothetical protein QOJ99_4310 [Bryobacterales bacterium]|nr:hypothetical protein [Bryobacterales bacterium]
MHSCNEHVAEPSMARSEGRPRMARSEGRPRMARDKAMSRPASRLSRWPIAFSLWVTVALILGVLNSSIFLSPEAFRWVELLATGMVVSVGVAFIIWWLYRAAVRWHRRREADHFAALATAYFEQLG